MQIPNDPAMLLSVINTLLRDKYSSLNALCEDMNISREEIEKKLALIDYSYSAEQNAFI